MDQSGQVTTAARGATAAAHALAPKVRATPGLGIRSRDPQALKDAVESLLMGELLKPLEETLRESGLFPRGASGEIYAHLWKTHMGELLAQSIDLFPGWAPPSADNGASGAEGEASGAPAALPRVRFPRALAPATLAALPRAAPAGRLPLPRPTEGVPTAVHARKLRPFENLIREAAQQTGVAANWLRAVIVQESAAVPDAVSRKGAVGLMQLLPSTATALGVRNLRDPQENIFGGARYFSSLLSRFGDVRLALAAYNAGPARVEKFGGVPPFAETRRYVSRVLQLKDAFDRAWPADAH